MRGLRASFDPEWGGFGRAPKFPPHSVLELLLRRGETEMAERTLDGMAAGGMYDVVGGGFHRYSVDERWLVPHFEKMLYDNALLVPAYLHAWLVTGRERYREVVEETVEYMLRDLLLPDGAFASSQDADTDGVEGLTYTWTEEEGVPAELLEPFEHGRSIVRGELDPELRARLLEIRGKRPQPGLDDKAIASWNGLALAALAEAARRLERDDWLDTARGLAEFLLGPLSDEGRLRRSYREGRATGTGYLDDYANVAHGLYELHVATGELRWLEESRRLALLAVELFRDDERGGFFLTPSDGEALVVRTKDLDDNPIPSGNSMLAFVLLRLARIYGDDELERHAVSVLRLVRDLVPRAPAAFGWALCAPRPPLLPAARDRDHRLAGRCRREGCAGRLRPERRRRLRPVRGRAAAPGQGSRGRQAGRLRLRALRLPGAGHGPGSADFVVSSRRGAARGAKSHPPLRRHRRRRRRHVRRAARARSSASSAPTAPGKTTVFNLVTRLYSPDGGDIEFEGESLLAGPAAQGRRPGHRAHVPEPRALPLDDGARERPRRLARPQAAGGGGRSPRAVAPRVRGPRGRRVSRGRVAAVRRSEAG